MKKISVLLTLLLLFPAGSVIAAYHHGTDTDSEVVLQAYPAVEGTKLDSCTLCHSGGQYEKKPGVFVSLGSCQWCHYSYGYDESGDINSTLNSYGEAYQVHGKSLRSLVEIEEQDSDLDGYSNRDEIAALRYPGNPEDDPTKVAAPYRVISKSELESMPSHSQIMLMNTHKSGDFYAEYGGVSMAELLEYSGILELATGITVFAPDGWAQYHPLEEDSDPLMYHVYGEYPQAEYYYHIQADQVLNQESGWCDYSSSALIGLESGSLIEVDGGLRLLLAYSRDGESLEPGQLTDDNKLDGEGPFRVVPPQKQPGPPDQSVKSEFQAVEWPFDDLADHNAGFATRSATIIKVEPLPEGTTDIDTLEAGWNYVDQGKLLIYGAIDPLATVFSKLSELKQLIRSMDVSDFKQRPMKRNVLKRIGHLEKSLKKDHVTAFASQLESLASKMDGCLSGDSPDRNDWLTECTSQRSAYWSVHEVEVLMGL